MDQNGNLFFALVDPPALACWNTRTPYNVDNIRIVYRDDKTMQFASGLKITTNLRNEEEIWLLTNRLQVKTLL